MLQVELFAVGSRMCSIWDGRLQINKSVVFQTYRDYCFWKEIWTPYLTLQIFMQHHTASRPEALSTTLNAKEQVPNHSGRCWAKPLDLQPSGPPVPRCKALGSAQTRHRHQLGSTTSTALSCSLPWEADQSAALRSFSLLFWITLWKTQTSPRTFRDVTYQESNFFPYFPKWAWIGLQKTLLNP